MKANKTFRAVIATALALIFMLGTVTGAFAVNDSIVWTADGKTVTCEYYSELAPGINTVSIENDGWYCFDVSDFENGFYSAKITNNVFEYFVAPDKTGDEYEGWGDVEINYGDDVDTYFFSIGDSNDMIVGGAYCGGDNVKIEVEYLGSEITALEFGNDELLIGYDITDNQDRNGLIVTDLITIVTDGGKKTGIGYQRIFFTCDDTLEKGENAVVPEILGEEIEQTINVGFVSDYIKGVVHEKANAIVYYNYMVEFTQDVYREFTVEFTDGTRRVCDDGNVTLPNGREITIYPYYQIDFKTFEVSLGYYARQYEVAAVETVTTKASFIDNVRLFMENQEMNFQLVKNCMREFTETLAVGDFQSAAARFGYFLNELKWFVSNTLEEINSLIRFVST